MFDKLIDLLKQFGRFFVFWYVMDPYEGSIILRMGKFHKKAKVGLNWILPFVVDRVLGCNIATHTLVVGPQSLMTKDGKAIVITTVITCTVEDSQPFILEINGGMTALDDAATGVVSRLIMQHTLQELLAMDMANELTKDVRRFAKPWGVGISRVQISDFSVTRSIRLLQSMSHTYPERKEF
jgi:regulator of protease activity HflC (stomatin/prohibitin superfamily)